MTSMRHLAGMPARRPSPSPLAKPPPVAIETIWDRERTDALRRRAAHKLAQLFLPAPLVPEARGAQASMASAPPSPRLGAFPARPANVRKEPLLARVIGHLSVLQRIETWAEKPGTRDVDVVVNEDKNLIDNDGDGQQEMMVGGEPDAGSDEDETLPEEETGPETESDCAGRDSAVSILDSTTPAIENAAALKRPCSFEAADDSRMQRRPRLWEFGFPRQLSSMSVSTLQV